MQVVNRSIFKTFLILGCFTFPMIAYLPRIIESNTLYNAFGIVNIVFFGALLFLTFRARLIGHIEVLSVYFAILMIFFTETLIFSILNFNINFEDIRKLSIPFIALLIGFNINIPVKRYLDFLVIYCVAALIISLFSVSYYIGGFVILDQYMVNHKNGLGAIISNSLAILMCMLFLKDIRNHKKILFIIFSVILFACLIVLRARAAFVAIAFCSAVLIWIYLKNKRYGYLIFASIIIGIIVLNLIFPSIFQAFFLGSDDMSDLDGVSSGRINRNLAALKFIKDYPVLGQLTKPYFLEQIHNYLLIKVTEYGFLGSLPLLGLYLYLVATVVKKVSVIKEVKTEYFGYLVLIIPLIISLFEPGAPYGPGSVQFIIYFMLGYSLKNYSQKAEIPVK